MLTIEQLTVRDFARRQTPAPRDMIIVGRPGTGKSATFRNNVTGVTDPSGYTVAFARRALANSVPNECSTIYSLVGLTPPLAGAYGYDPVTLTDFAFRSGCKFGHVIAEYDILYIEEAYTVPAWQMAVLLNLRAKYEDQLGKRIRIIIIGDPYQCTPVGRGGGGRHDPFAFWFEHVSITSKLRNIFVAELKKQHRQYDEHAVYLLDAFRAGRIEENHLEMLRSRRTDVAVLPPNTTILVALRSEKSMGNMKELRSRFPLEDHIVLYAQWGKNKQSTVDHTITVAVGACVVFTTNNGDEWYRGQNATIVSIDNYTGVASQTKSKHFSSSNNSARAIDVGTMVVRLQTGRLIELKPTNMSTDPDDSEADECYRQFPIELAYYVTINQSQGMTLDPVAMYLGNVFAAGQAYTALSRMRSLSGLYILSLDEAKIRNPLLHVLPVVRAYASTLAQLQRV